YLSERKHLQTLPLNLLSDSRLGIDAAHYLQSLYDGPDTKEQLLAATGGLPLTLSTRIEADLRVLEKLRIKPVFVFPGLQPKKSWRQQNHNMEQREACGDRASAWSKYEAGYEEPAYKLFEGRHGLTHWDLWRTILRIFRNRNVEFLVAPYVSWAQLIYLQRHPKSYIHSIYGPTDTLLYPGVDKLITSVNFTANPPTFTFVSKKSILGDLGVSEDQFLDIGILVGFDHIQPFPPTMHDQGLKATVDMVKFYKSGHMTVTTYNDQHTKSLGYQDLYARTRAMVKYSLILTAEGTCQPLPLAAPPPGGAPSSIHHPTAADIPSDLHEIFTHRLPDEVYFYISRGLLAPAPLVWLTSGSVLESPPLDNGETTEYRRFVKEVITEGHTGPRATALALISSALQPFWANRKITAFFWFEHAHASPGQAKLVQHSSPATAQLVERVSSWHVPYAIVEEELRRQNSSTIDFALCLGATATEKQAARTRIKSGAKSSTLEKKDELVANVIWRFLELRGFLLKTHEHSPLARSMHTAVRSARLNDKFQEPLYLFLELVRAGVMHGNLWSSRAFSGGPSFGTDDEKSSMLLVMRTLSIVPLNFKPQPWSAPLSRELLVFNSFVRSLSRALRTLAEVTTLNLLLRQDAERKREDLLDIGLSLPFQSEVNTGFGVLAKVYLDALTHINGGQRVRDARAEGVADAKQIALDICEETFPGVKDPRREVERGFRFWDVVS
ncbi:XPG I-region protein, partial [Peniophora sp. CONT]